MGLWFCYNFWLANFAGCNPGLAKNYPLWKLPRCKRIYVILLQRFMKEEGYHNWQLRGVNPKLAGEKSLFLFGQFWGILSRFDWNKLLASCLQIWVARSWNAKRGMKKEGEKEEKWEKWEELSDSDPELEGKCTNMPAAVPFLSQEWNNEELNWTHRPMFRRYPG